MTNKLDSSSNGDEKWYMKLAKGQIQIKINLKRREKNVKNPIKSKQIKWLKNTENQIKRK